MDIKDSVPTAAEFPLPTLGPKLKDLLEEVKTGRGFQLIRYWQRCPLVELLQLHNKKYPIQAWQAWLVTMCPCAHHL